MNTMHFSIIINAPKEKVWNTMLDDATYREWTTPFSEGSYYKGDWSEGSKMLFLGPDPKTGIEGGMVARIKENRPHEFLSIEHLGEVHGDVEDTTSERVQAWAGALENYTLNDTAGGGTEVLIDLIMDKGDEPSEEMKQMEEMFQGMWPKALQKLKEIAER